jgi:aryl-alcohol dehydrogenase-like predicted oxidoreductase
MERRRLGDSDLELSVIGLGTWVFGGRWGGADDADSLAACHAAFDAGVNWVDTADVYGQGRAERILGRALRERREDIIVATKGGVAWETEPAFRIWREASADYLRMACDRSLQALGVDVIDLYQVHWPVRGVPPEETIGALVELREAGKVRAIGVSNYEIAHLEAAGAVARIDAYQPGYHLMRRDIEAAALSWCAEHGVGVIAYGPLAHGLLTGKMTEATTFAPTDWRAQSELFSDEAFPERVAVVRELETVAAEAGRPGGVAELAVAWVLRRPEVTAAIVGARSAAQAVRNAALAGAPLSADEEAAIDEVLARHPAASGHYGHGEPPDPGGEAEAA